MRLFILTRKLTHNGVAYVYAISESDAINIIREVSDEDWVILREVTDTRVIYYK